MPEKFEHFANTKILATLGPATFESEIIKKLILSGIDGVRLNFSHGDYNFFSQLYKNIYTACVDEKTPLSVLVDLQGPKIRIGDLSEPYFDIKEGNIIEITIDKIIGNNKKISTNYSQLPKDAEIGDRILIDDGLLRFTIIDKKENSVICQSLNSGKLKPRKGMNLPGMKLSTPSITEKDFADLKFALNNRVDYIALSFVRSPEDVVKLKSWLIMNGLDIPVIAKIEKKEAVDHFDDILSVSD